MIVTAELGEAQPRKALMESFGTIMTHWTPRLARCYKLSGTSLTLQSHLELGTILGSNLFELKYCIIMDQQLQLELKILRNYLGIKSFKNLANIYTSSC